MKIRLGSILPINYDLWPTEIEDALMAFVVELKDNLVTLCPVHTNLEAASLSDLIIPPEENSLKTLLIIMTKHSRAFPIRALSNELFDNNGKNDWKQEFELADDECGKFLEQVTEIQANSDYDSYFKILRGRVLRRDSLEWNWVNELGKYWIKFLLSAQVKEIEHRIDDFPANMPIIKFLASVKEIINQSIFKLDDDNNSTLTPVSSNEVLPNAANMSIGRPGDLKRDNRETFNSLKSEILKIIESRNLLENYKLQLSSATNDNPSPLLETLLRLYPGKS